MTLIRADRVSVNPGRTVRGRPDGQPLSLGVSAVRLSAPVSGRENE
jgi:hypothetical protein